MATPLTNAELKQLPNAKQTYDYPWDTWLDGRAWRISIPDDLAPRHQENPNLFRMLVYNRSKTALKPYRVHYKKGTDYFIIYPAPNNDGR